MHTDEELREMAGYVVYEIEEFGESIAECDRLRKTDGAWNRHLWNRTLESALLHFRNLRGFFIDRPKSDDVSAQHYVSTWFPTPDLLFNTTRNALNKKLSHLTWSRVPWTAGKWDLAAMKLAIDTLFEEFKKSLTGQATYWFGPTATITLTRGHFDGESNSTVSGSKPTLLG